MRDCTIPRPQPDPCPDAPNCDMPNLGKAQLETFLAGLLLKHLESDSK